MAETKQQPKTISVTVKFKMDQTSEAIAKKLEKKDFRKAVEKEAEFLLSHKLKFNQDR